MSLDKHARRSSAFPSRFLRGMMRFTAVAFLPILLAGCFQPMYGEHSVAGGPGLRDRLGAVEVLDIQAPKGSTESRLGIEVRNALIFDLTGGSSPAPATHRLTIKLRASRTNVIVDVTTARPDIEISGIDATYILTEIATDKVVASGSTFSRVSYDIPGQAQRFARARGLRDAENRAAKVIADNISQRLASFFVTGG